MADDFRSLLQEEYRSESGWGRTYKDIEIKGVFRFSVQASETHASTPEATLDDPHEYTAFEVTLSQLDAPFIDTPGRGAWDEIKKLEWADRFGRGDIAGVRIAENLPVDEVQRVYEDLLAYAENKGK